jgi:hypothetical protein
LDKQQYTWKYTFCDYTQRVRLLKEISLTKVKGHSLRNS